MDGHRCSPLPSAVTPVPLGPAQGPAWHAQPVWGQPGSAPSAPGLPLHVPSSSHVTAGHRAWPHLCHSQLSSSDSRKQGRKKTWAGRGQKEGEGEVRRLRSAVRSRATDNHRARGFQCPPQLPPALCPVAWQS